MNATTQWAMMKDALREVLADNPGYRVTTALFTTYGFEPDFFEYSIIPLLLPEGEGDFSLHPVVRRVQLEAHLREHPMKVDVYFDGRVAVPGCPLLPYNMIPMHPNQAEFHGKVILLLLDNGSGNPLCTLGVGSANLTKAGWWENLEGWYFTPAFQPGKTPAGLLPGIQQLLEYLNDRQQKESAHEALSKVFEDARKSTKERYPIFGVFTGSTGFTTWLKKHVPQAERQITSRPLDVISPYFAQSGHDTLVDQLCEAVGAKNLKVWLPIDVWQSGGPAALIEESAYTALGELKALTWSEFSDPALVEARAGKATPRLLHAKVIRRPGHFCFMGSVNFSNKAFWHNYEAGFLFEDDGKSWLRNTQETPQRFIRPQEEALLHDEAVVSRPEILATFSWKTRTLTFSYLKRSSRKPIAFSVLRSQGEDTLIRIEIPSSTANGRTLDEAHPMLQDLITNPWVKLRFNDGSIGLTWVQHQDLEYRPLGADLNPDLLEILSLWRQLASGKTGSQPVIDLTKLEIKLSRRGGGGEKPPSGESERDLFAEMSDVHAGFFLLRQQLKKDPHRVSYYFGADRPDTLPTLLAKTKQQISEGAGDPVVIWVILQWVIQICNDHQNACASKMLGTQAQSALQQLQSLPVFAALDARILDWSQSMFLTTPGKERSVGKHLRPAKAGSK